MMVAKSDLVWKRNRKGAVSPIVWLYHVCGSLLPKGSWSPGLQTCLRQYSRRLATGRQSPRSVKWQAWNGMLEQAGYKVLAGLCAAVASTAAVYQVWSTLPSHNSF